MARRTNHYEAAFEAWLRRHQVPCVAIDETRRSLVGSVGAISEPLSAAPLGDEASANEPPPRSLKSVDFIVSPGGEASWLVDVKGRRFPTGHAPHRARYWMNWTTRDELASMAHWEELFGPRFNGLFVFAYHVIGDRSPLPLEQLFLFRNQYYAFVGIRLDHYLSWQRPLNAKWDTVTVRTRKFRELARPAAEVFGIAAPRRMQGA
jgi:hypothetical protein